jgi:hypothetical protein
MLVIYAPYYAAFALFPVPEAVAIALAMLILESANQHYLHSNLNVPYVKQLESVLVTPRFHFVHHSAKPHFANSNYGFIFSVWDRMFGTYTDPATIPADDPLGIDYEISGWRLALGVPPRPERRDPLAPRARRTADLEAQLVSAPSAQRK